jgi:cyclopropane-fatty-acyl-phospholipid synthase
MTRPATLKGTFTIQQRDETHFLDRTTKKMSDILAQEHLRLRVTVDKNSIIIGDRYRQGRAIPGFKFVSTDTFERLFKRLRLVDFAMAYFDGTMQVLGSVADAVDVLDAMNLATDRTQTPSEFVKLLFFRAFKAVTSSSMHKFESLDHYAQSAEAYELFLDSHMQYTCGYFRTGKETLDEAQVSKFELINQLTGPLTGKSHLDIGCGWGGLMDFFQNQYGTFSQGITNCRPQSDYINKRYGVKAILGDFGELKDNGEQFDLVTVVGMMEHLTPWRQNQLFKMIHELLKNDGYVYLQCIAKPACWIGGDAYRIVQREIFPGHYLDYTTNIEKRLKRCGFVVRTQLDHTSHYALTTAYWVDKIQCEKARLIAFLGERQYRSYLGYLAMASKMFATGRGCLMRYVLTKNK